jgi:hypothetical protein
MTGARPDKIMGGIELLTGRCWAIGPSVGSVGTSVGVRVTVVVGC